ncbi:MAG: hypothetical protein CL858_14805, partial [Cupriavidus sp.]|nr:hypothetical protein [Cupriavidus sp.]
MLPHAESPESPQPLQSLESLESLHTALRTGVVDRAGLIAHAAARAQSEAGRAVYLHQTFAAASQVARVRLAHLVACDVEGVHAERLQRIDDIR